MCCLFENCCKSSKIFEYDDEFQQALEEAIAAYIKALQAIGVVVKVRRSRGKDIDAACGQLANHPKYIQFNVCIGFEKIIILYL